MSVTTINMFSLSATVIGVIPVLRQNQTVNPVITAVTEPAAEGYLSPTATMSFTIFTVPQAITAAQISIARGGTLVYSRASIYSLTVLGDNWLELREQPSTITWAGVVDITFELFLNSTGRYDGVFTNFAAITVAQTLYSQPPLTTVPPKPGSVEPARTSRLVYDSSTGTVLHHHQTVTLPGATAPSDAVIDQDALKLAASIAGVPSTRKTAVLKVDTGKIQNGFAYKVDVKTKSLVALNPPKTT